MSLTGHLGVQKQHRATWTVPSGHFCSVKRVSTVDTIWAPYGDPLQGCMCFYRDPNYLQPILNPGGNCHCILVAAQYCLMIKKSGYTIEYWIFKTAQKGYLHRGLWTILTIQLYYVGHGKQLTLRADNSHAKHNILNNHLLISTKS